MLRRRRESATFDMIKCAVPARVKRFDLSRHGEQNFTAVKLLERLPRLAIEAAEEIDETK
jgi:hypothetical protein